MKEIHRLLHQLFTEKGSDLHLSEGYRPRMRLHGELVDMEAPPLTREVLYGHMQALLSEAKFKEFLSKGDLDFAWEWEGVARFRCNYLISQSGLGAVLRLVPEAVVPFSSLMMPSTIVKFTQQRSGLILLTGPTGSGKSTTMAALVDHINATRRSYIATIEDPIEFVHQNKKSFVVQREVGSHTRSFSAALRACLRENLDVLMVGELRDKESTELSLNAAEMGFLVLATLHTGSAATGIARMVDMFPLGQRGIVRQSLANCLIGIVTQTLLRRPGGQGRVPACEVLVATGQLRHMLREGALHQIPSAFQQGASAGCQTMDQSIMGLVQRRLVDRNEARLRLQDKALMP